MIMKYVSNYHWSHIWSLALFHQAYSETKRKAVISKREQHPLKLAAIVEKSIFLTTYITLKGDYFQLKYSEELQQRMQPRVMWFSKHVSCQFIKLDNCLWPQLTRPSFMWFSSGEWCSQLLLREDLQERDQTRSSCNCRQISYVSATCGARSLSHFPCQCELHPYATTEILAD